MSDDTKTAGIVVPLYTLNASGRDSPGDKLSHKLSGRLLTFSAKEFLSAPACPGRGYSSKRALLRWRPRPYGKGGRTGGSPRLWPRSAVASQRVINSDF